MKTTRKPFSTTPAPFSLLVGRKSLCSLKKTFFIASLVFYLCLPLPTAADPCVPALRKLQVFKKDPNSYRVAYKNGPVGEGFLTAVLLEGTLKFSVHSRTSSGELRDLRFHASEAFEQMLQHFGNRVKTIQGNWILGGNPALQSNIQQFNAAIERGLSPEEAAFETWTGKQAKKYGYNKVEFIVLEYESSLNDSSTNFGTVVVEFTK